MNTKEDMKEQPSSMMSLLSWLSEVTKQRSSIASLKELKSCSVLLVLCENLLSKERDLRKRTKKTNDDDADDEVNIISVTSEELFFRSLGCVRVRQRLLY